MVGDAAYMSLPAGDEHGAACQPASCEHVAPVDIARGQREALASDWLQLLRAAGFHYRTTVIWAEGNVSRCTARGSIDSPSAINLICPAEVVLVVHKGHWNLGRTDASDLEHEKWLALTLAAWSFAGEHAGRVGYPAASPEELPAPAPETAVISRRPGDRSVRWQRHDHPCEFRVVSRQPDARRSRGFWQLTTGRRRPRVEARLKEWRSSGGTRRCAIG